MDFLQRTLDGLLEAGPYALVGLGLTLGFGMLRRVNLAYGAGAMLGAYLGSWLHVRMGWPALAVLVCMVLAAALAGLYVQWLCFHDTDRSTGTPQLASMTVSGADAREVVALASSFAVWMQLEQLCVNLLPRHLNPFPDFASTSEWALGPLGLRPYRLLMCALAVLLVLWMTRWMQRSRTGWPCVPWPITRWPPTCPACRCPACSAWALCWPAASRVWPPALCWRWKARSRPCSACGC